MENIKLRAALKYQGMGFSVIPCRKDKKSYVKWEQYQKKPASQDQIEAWWSRWPDANPAIICGEVSGIDVVDVDSIDGWKTIQDLLPDSLQIPTTKTAKGYHLYFLHTPGLLNMVRFLKDCDFKTTDGYVLAPPGENEAGGYAWVDGLPITETKPPPLPEMIRDILEQGSIASEHPSASIIYNENVLSRGDLKTSKSVGDFNRLQVTSDDFKEGTRDNDLFHLANCLFKGGMPDETIRKYLFFYASHCEPPFPEKEVLAKIESAKKRVSGTGINISEEVRDFVVTSSGFFLTSDCFNRLQVTSRSEKKAVVLELLRLHNKGTIERHGQKNGCYRKIEGECEPMDFLNAKSESVALWLPFNLHKMVNLMPGNVVLVAGSPNAGKTAFLLNIIKNNMHKFEIHYFNSEMGGLELKTRLEKFDDIQLSEWNFHPWERSENFADVIKPGPDKINVVDFLEIFENFYEIGGKIAEIHRKLKGAIGIIALQKNPGADTGLGGFRTLEKPRLALAVESSTIKIVKAKNWAGTSNPNGKQTRFKLVNGCRLSQQGDWNIPIKQ